MISVLLCATLQFTAPARDTAGAAMADTLTCAVVRQKQSPIWQAFAPCGNPALDARVWRYVIAEAAPDTVAWMRVAPAVACSLSVDATNGPWIWNVVTRQARSPWSGRSNECFK